MQHCCVHVVLIDRMLAPLCKISYRLSFDYEKIRSGSGIYTIWKISVSVIATLMANIPFQMTATTHILLRSALNTKRDNTNWSSMLNAHAWTVQRSGRWLNILCFVFCSPRSALLCCNTKTCWVTQRRYAGHTPILRQTQPLCGTMADLPTGWLESVTDIYLKEKKDNLFVSGVIFILFYFFYTITVKLSAIAHLQLIIAFYKKVLGCADRTTAG